MKAIVLILLALVLAGCAAGGQPGGQPAGSTPATDGYGDYGQPTLQASATTAGNGAAPVQATEATAPTTAAPVIADTATVAVPATEAAPTAASTTAATATLAAIPLPTAGPTQAGAAAPTQAVPVTGTLLLTADDLMDFQVADPSGNLIGDVEDLIIDLKAAGNGQAPFIVISSELNDDWLIPVPWQYVQVRPEWQAVVVPVAGNQIFNAPGFNEDFWPADIGDAWRANVNNFWQNPAAVTGPGTIPTQPMFAQIASGYIRAKDLLGMDLVDARGLELAEVKDLAIDWANSGAGTAAAQFNYAIADRDENLGLGGENIPIPWRLVRPSPQQQAILMNVAAQVLQTAPSFNDINRPDLYAQPWSAELARFWDLVK